MSDATENDQPMAVGERIESLEQLDALYGAPNAVSLRKELDRITPGYRRLIEASPFVVVASVAEEGLDCSPRGDPAGFVRVAGERTVMIPDRRGNNRIDTLRNLVRDPRISLLFMIPGCGETLRINGRAELLTEAALCESFAIQGKAPRCVISVTVGSVYFQCQRALVRAGLWDPASQVDRASLPTTGEMLTEAMSGDFDGESYDAALPERLKQTIY